MMSHSSFEATSTLEFFKVFLPDSCSLHMSIPPAFTKHLNGTFPEKATIQDHTGKSWCIALEKLDDLLYFKNGWQAFVDYHSLKYGNFLVFQYDGHCTFDVKIFGKNGCKKAVPAKAASSVPILEAEIVEANNFVSNSEAMVADAGNSASNLEAMVTVALNSVSNSEPMIADAGNSVSNLEIVVADAGNSVPILKVKEEPVDEEDVEPSISRKRKRLQDGSEIVRKSKSIVASNHGRPDNASNSLVVSPRGPFFERKMKRWSSQTIYISGRIVRDKNIWLKPNIVFRDEEGILWPATVCFTSQNRISVTAGWSKFYASHELKVNDKCDFEFVLEKGNVCQQLNVRITHRCRALR